MRYLLCTLLIAVAVAVYGQQETVYLWNFNAESLTPSVSSGATTPTLSLVGGTSSTFVSGGVNGGSTDSSETNRALNTTNYPESMMAPRTAGIQIAFDATQLQNLSFSFDVRASNTAANQLQVQYSTNNQDWQNVTALTIDSGTTWRSFSTPLNNFVSGSSDNFIRVVTDFSGNDYAPANSNSNYGPGGTLRYDMIRFAADPVSSIQEKKDQPWFVASVENNILRISAGNRVTSLKLMDITGAIITQWDTKQQQALQTTLPASGMYFLIALDGTHFYTQKISH